MLVESRIEAVSDVFNQEVTTVAREFYHQLYNEEVALNLVFNTFVANYKAAYEGRNIRKDQVLDSAAKRKFGSSHEREFRWKSVRTAVLGNLGTWVQIVSCTAQCHR